MAKLIGYTHGIPEYVALMKEYAQHQEYVRGCSKEGAYITMLICQRFGRFLLDHYGEIPGKITKLHIVAYMRNTEGRRRSTTIDQLGRLKRFFRYLERAGRITTNPVESIRIKSHPARIGEVLTIDEIDKLLDSFDNVTTLDVRNTAIIETLYNTGIRVAELCSIDMGDYMPEEGCVKIKGKGYVERLTPIGGSAIIAIDIYLKRRKEIARYRFHRQPLFVSQNGRPLKKRDVQKILEVRAKIVGIKHTTPHMLRRSCATHMLRAGAPLRYVQEQLGHKCISSTQRYIKLTPEDLVRVYRKAKVTTSL